MGTFTRYLVVLLVFATVDTTGTANDTGTVDHNAEKSRPKRQSFLTNSLQGSIGGGAGAGSVEGLLASCQLTNLLLYQLLQQQSPSVGIQFQSPGNAAAAPFPQPFPAAAGFVNNFLFPPRLTTYVTTSTFTQQTTSSTVITIPLLFGNKPSLTTITRTKIYDITTSQVETITTTIEPSTAITPTSTSDMVKMESTRNPIPPQDIQPPRDLENDLESPNFNPIQYQLDNQGVPEKNFRLRRKNEPFTSSVPPTKTPRVAVRKVLRKNPGTTTESYVDTTPAYRYGPESHPVAKTFKLSPREFKQSPRDYSRENYYEAATASPYRQQNQPPPSYGNEDPYAQPYPRRLKRRGDADSEENDQQEGMILNREFLLEPSFTAETPTVYQYQDQCPPPKEITITKTITKFVNPTPLLPVPLVPEAATRLSRWEPPPPELRQRTARKYQPSKTYSSFFQVSETLPEFPTTTQTPTRKRERQNVAVVETTTEALTRSRGRGDILYRSRGSTQTATAPLEATEGNEFKVKTLNESRRGGGQRRQQRRPVTN